LTDDRQNISGPSDHNRCKSRVARAQVGAWSFDALHWVVREADDASISKIARTRCGGASNDQTVINACRFYVLGVVQGVGLGDGTTFDASRKQMVERKKTIFCIPDDMSQVQMVSLVRDLLALEFKGYPEDRKLAAAGVVAGIMHTRFPCSPR